MKFWTSHESRIENDETSREFFFSDWKSIDSLASLKTPAEVALSQNLDQLPGRDFTAKGSAGLVV